MTKPKIKIDKGYMKVGDHDGFFVSESSFGPMEESHYRVANQSPPQHIPQINSNMTKEDTKWEINWGIKSKNRKKSTFWYKISKIFKKYT